MGGGDGDRVKVSTKQGIFFLGGGLVDKWRAWQKQIVLKSKIKNVVDTGITRKVSVRKNQILKFS